MRLTGNAGRKNFQKFVIWAPVHSYVFATEARIDNWKKLVKQQYLPHMFPQYGGHRPTNGEFGVPQQISTDFASWQRYCTAL